VNRKRLGILISGRGSNMEALLKAAADPAWPAEAAVVISNKPGAGGLAVADRLGVKAFAIDHKPYGKDREAFERDLDTWLHREDVDLVALAGFMRVLTPWFVNAWEGKLLNIHPSLLPKYPGVDTHERALAAGDTVHGCSVHFVTAGVDEGPVVGRAEVDIKPGDTADTLAARVLTAEHLLYPRCVAAVAAGWDGLTQYERVEVGGDVVRMTVPR
jgi:formyltetrahydrofolate-dependent phosphoribosylglycinamide formyltransferase